VHAPTPNHGRPTATPPASWPSPIALEPFDLFNAALLRNVAPGGWIAPTPKARYHLVVIGAGTAGLVSAAIAAGLGARVALVERHMFGGDCLNFGCVPSKAFIRAARAWHDASHAAGQFAGPAVSGAGDFGAVMVRVRELRARMSAVDGVARFRDLGVDVFLGDAQFVSRDAVRVREATLAFRRAMIATGARAAVPPIPGLSDTPFDTNESIFSVTELPHRLVVIGGGPIGVELAQSIARFGSAVTLVHADARVLPREDPDAAEIVARSLAADGVRVINGARIDSVRHADGVFSVQLSGDGVPPSVDGERLLVATGRRPNIEGLGLEAAGVTFARNGVTVDDRFRTSNPRVFAIGDVSSALQFTHVADAQARLAVANALFFGMGGGKNSRLVIPRVTYSSPEVAHVGLTPADAEARGERVETVRVDLTHNDRSVLEGDEDGFLKVHLRQGSDRILGATLVAAHAGEMIGEMGVAITNGLGLGAVGKTVHAYPTQSEVFRRAADVWRRGRLTPTALRVFSWWFRMFQ
jgi:pyruvate/2-oxoglutarate dehydrogenase complex dihydrolipoamide dehydrogenase (E3) component